MFIKKSAVLIVGVAVIFCYSLFVYLSKAKAQDLTPTVSYQGQNTSVFQMFFSPHVRADTFLVNTAKGIVWVTVSTKAGDQAFQKVPVAPPPDSSTVQAGRFRIYYSAMVRRDTFLTDTTTGKIWVLAQDKDKNAVFQTVEVEGIYP